jgi:hypothetical protein
MIYNKRRYNKALAKWKADNNLPPDATMPEKPNIMDTATEDGEWINLDLYGHLKKSSEYLLWLKAPKPEDYWLRPKSWIGTGLMFKGQDIGGSFRIKPDTHVEYLFFTILFLPIIPVECYRLVTRTRQIVSTEPLKIGEVLHIYFEYIIVLLAFLLVISFALS